MNDDGDTCGSASTGNDDGLPDEVNARVYNHLRYVFAPQLNDKRRDALLRALDGRGVSIGEWMPELGVLAVQVLTDTGAIDFTTIKLSELGLTVSADCKQLGFVPSAVDSK